VLRTAYKGDYIFEPDNEIVNPISWLYKQHLHRFPYLSTDDNDETYEKMWRVIIRGHYNFLGLYSLIRKYFCLKIHALEAHVGVKTGYMYIDDTFNNVSSPVGVKPYSTVQHSLLVWILNRLISPQRSALEQRNVIIKSVHSPLCLSWLSHHFRMKIVVVLRNPYSLFASYKRMKMPDSFRNLLYQKTLQRDFGEYIKHPVTRIRDEEEHRIIQMGLMLKILAVQLSNHSDWIVISHDRFCLSPKEMYRDLFHKLRLSWHQGAEEKIDALNESGSGFVPFRLTHMQPTKWHSELTAVEQALIAKWVEAFELTGFFNEYVYT
jgi:hypothetical protein